METLGKYLLDGIANLVLPKALSAISGSKIWQENIYVMGTLFAFNKLILQLSYDACEMIYDEFNDFLSTSDTQEPTKLIGLDGPEHADA